MIEVHGPDGAIHKFEDNASEDFIRKVMSKHYGLDGSTPNSVGPKEIPVGDKSSEYTLSGLITGKNKYQEAAGKKADKLDKMGLMDAGVGQRLFQGMTLGAGDEAQAILDTPIAMIEQGTFNPIEGYKYSKEFQNERLNRSKKNTGFAGDVAELAGGIATGANAARNGLTFLKQGQNLGGRMLSAAKEGAAYGGITGAATNEGEDRFSGAAKGAALGAGIGAAIPVAASGFALTPAAPIVSNIMSMRDPQGAAQSRLARALVESGRSGDDVMMELSNAAAAGQGEYALADALGVPGQKLLSMVSRAPGEGARKSAEFLNARQANQADRVTGIVDEALGADMTGRAASAAKGKEAVNASKKLYQEAFAEGPIYNDRLEQFLKDPISRQGLNRGLEIQRLEALAEGKKFNPYDIGVTGFDEAGEPIVGKTPNMRLWDAVKRGIDDMLDQYRDKQSGKVVLDQRGRAIEGVRKEFLKELDSVNSKYAAARAAYAGPAAEREAIGLGRRAATSGRSADNIEVFNSMKEGPQRGFRVGYADKLNEGVERGRLTHNAAGKLSPGKTQAEMDAITLDQGPLRPGERPEYAKRIAREETMFETRSRALGGSRTADNLADEAEAQIDPRIFANLLSGNFTEAAKNAGRGAGNLWGGNTPNVRSQLADMLLQGGQNPNIRTMIQDIEQRGVAGDALARALSRALMTGSVEYSNQR